MTTAPQTNRPEALEDIRFQHQLKDDAVCYQPKITSDEIAKWWGNTLAAAADTPGLKVKEGGIIVSVMTDEEKQEVLVEEQKSYDKGLSLYQHYLDTGEQPEYQFQWETYLHHEGITIKDETND